MTSISDFFNHCYSYAAIALLALVSSSCGNSQMNIPMTPISQTVQVTQLVTILVIHDVTREVTRVVENPVTVTPAITPPSTFATSPNSIAPGSNGEASQPLDINILQHSDCMYGPGAIYLYKYSVFSDIPMEAIGRNWDGSWLYIQEVNGWNPCWIQSTFVKIASGDINQLPIVYSKLPYSNQYNSPDASAHRDGSKVTISWKADWMSLDDYRGYLVEAWLCKGGVQVFDPISYVPPLASNVGTLSITVTDDPGCPLPSSARIYSAQKQGYSNWSNIPWPAAAPGD